jgi:hypothetical protein
MKPKHPNGQPDTRYTVGKEYTGHAQTQHVARWLGERIGADLTKQGAWDLCRQHRAGRDKVMTTTAGIWRNPE